MENNVPTRGDIYFVPVYDEAKDEFFTDQYYWNGDIVDIRYLALGLVYMDEKECRESCKKRNDVILQQREAIRKERELLKD